MFTTPDKPVSSFGEGPMSGSKVYIDVFNFGQQINEPFAKKWIELGATISKKMTDNTTVVIWRDGKKTTWQSATQRGLPLVSPLWIQRWDEAGRLLDHSDYILTKPEQFGKRPQKGVRWPSSKPSKSDQSTPFITDSNRSHFKNTPEDSHFKPRRLALSPISTKQERVHQTTIADIEYYIYCPFALENLPATMEQTQDLFYANIVIDESFTRTFHCLYAWINAIPLVWPDWIRTKDIFNSTIVHKIPSKNLFLGLKIGVLQAESMSKQIEIQKILYDLGSKDAQDGADIYIWEIPIATQQLSTRTVVNCQWLIDSAIKTKICRISKNKYKIYKS